ncbi:SymE family type I addiction module toxin [Serratia sp. D1N4]
MNITFTPEPIPELTLTGGALVKLGFTTGTRLQLTLQHHRLWITVVTDEATWEALCEASQDRQDLGADWVRENGELIIGGDWLTESGITGAEQLEVTAAPGVNRLQRRKVEVFQA